MNRIAKSQVVGRSRPGRSTQNSSELTLRGCGELNTVQVPLGTAEACLFIP